MEFIEKIMVLIAMSGAARSQAMEAIMLAKQNNSAAAAEVLDAASKELKEAHKVQTQLIQEEAGGAKHEITLLLIHAQDHLMNAMTVKDLAKEFVELYEHTHQLQRGKEITS
ncbi:Lichenan-specific phosphotransferase enzyme IIA component [compost metagenome]